MSAPIYGCDGNAQRYRLVPDEGLADAGECDCPTCLNWLVSQNPPNEAATPVLSTEAAW